MMNDTFMKEKPVLPLILSMALPMVLSMLVNSLYNIVDSFFVAQISEDAMTALSLVYPIQNFINAAGIGFGVGIDHYAFPLSIGLLTQIACMSETKLRRLFKQVHHCTIKEYIQNQRIAHAEFLLSHTDRPIQQITESIGYSHSGHFASLFRRTTGLLPGEYRRMTRK